MADTLHKLRAVKTMFDQRADQRAIDESIRAAEAGEPLSLEALLNIERLYRAACTPPVPPVPLCVPPVPLCVPPQYATQPDQVAPKKAYDDFREACRQLKAELPSYLGADTSGLTADPVDSDLLDELPAAIADAKRELTRARTLAMRAANADRDEPLEPEDVRLALALVQQRLAAIAAHIDKKRLQIRALIDRDIIEDELAALRQIKNEFAALRADLKELQTAADSCDLYDCRLPELLRAEARLASAKQRRSEFIAIVLKTEVSK